MLTLDGAAIAPIEADLPAAQRIVGELLSALSALAEPVANTRAKAAPQTVASAALGAAGPQRMGVASSTGSVVRLVGGVIGIATVGAVFTAAGGLHSPQEVAAGIHPALLTAGALSIVGAVVAAVGLTRPVAAERQLVTQH